MRCIARDGLDAVAPEAGEHDFEIRLMVGNDNLYEGFLSAVAFIEASACA